MKNPFPDPERAASSQFQHLLDSPAEAAFDSLTCLAAQILEVPVALFCLHDIAHDRQVFKSQFGLPQAWSGRRESPLSKSICQHVVAGDRVLSIPDARGDRLVGNHPAVTDFGVIAYLGAPVRMPDGSGTFCAIDTRPRDWSPADVAVITRLADCVAVEIQLRQALAASEAQRLRLDAENRRAQSYLARRDGILAAFLLPDITLGQRMERALAGGCASLGMERGMICRWADSAPELLYAHATVPDPAGLHMRADETALCLRVMQGDGIVALDGSAASGRRGDPHHPVTSYIGSPVIYEGVLHGTVSFSASLPRAGPWDDEDRLLIGELTQVIASWLALSSEVDRLRRSEQAMVDMLLSLH